MKKETVLIICESGRWRSRNLAKEVYKELKQKGRKIKIITAGFRNKESNPYINPLKFLAYMFMTPLKQELIDKSCQIIVTAPEIYFDAKKEFEIPRERIISYDIADCKSVFELLPFFNHKFKNTIKEYAKLYVDKHFKHSLIYQKSNHQPIS